MTGGAATSGRGGGPARTWSTDEAVAHATVAAATGDDRHAVTYRKADYWCRNGALGRALEQRTGSGNPRRWHGDDVVALAVIARVSAALAQLADGGGPAHRPGSVALYRQIGDAVRAGEREAIAFRLTEHVTIAVHIRDVVDVLALAGVTVSP